MFAGLNNACVSELGEPVTYTFKDGSSVSVNAIVELNSPEEQQINGVYVLLFFSQDDLGATPLRGEVVKVRGRDWVVYDPLVDAVGGCAVRARAV